MATGKSVDHFAGKLLEGSPDPNVRRVAAAAHSGTNPPAQTRSQIASLAGSLMRDAKKGERRVAASVQADDKPTKRR